MNQRKLIRFVEPVVQRRIVAAILTCVGVTAVVSACVTIWSLHALATSLPSDGNEVVVRSIPIGLRVGAIALLVSLPMLVMMGLAATMPLIGVHYRMRTYLRAVAEGRERKPLALRTGDPCHELAELINVATAVHRERDGAGASSTSSGAGDRDASREAA